MNTIVTTLFALSFITSASVTAEPGDPFVPRALTTLDRLGTAAAILERATAAAPAVIDIAVHFDSIVQIDIHTRGQPAVHTWEPIYLEDRVRLRAEIAALPVAGVIVPAPGGAVLDFSVEPDSAAGATTVTIDLPRIAWGRVESYENLTTIRLATERPASGTTPVPATLSDASPLIQRASVFAATAVDIVRTAAEGVVMRLGAAVRAIAAQAARIDVRSLLDRVKPHAETLGLGIAAALALLLLIIRMRRPRRRKAPAHVRPAANPWVVRTLAQRGAGVRDIAVQTGLSREAVLLMMRFGPAPPHAAERAAYGRNFPATLRAGALPLRMAS